MTKREVKQLYFFCTLALVIAAMILGLSFVAQKAGMEYVGPFTFNTLRSFIGCLALLPMIILAPKFGEPEYKNEKAPLIKGGILAGLVLFVAFSLNQYSIQYATAGKAGFITCMYIIFVPILAVFFKQKIKINVIISVFVALIGLYLLCFKGAEGIEIWDILLMVSAFFFAIHIMIVSHFSKKVSAFKLSGLQFLIMGTLSLPLMLMESPQLSAIIAGAKPILFIGVVVTGIAYTLQIFGQKATRPVVATLILSSEAVIAVLGGMFILGEVLTGKEILGCCLMGLALIISQLKR